MAELSLSVNYKPISKRASNIFLYSWMLLGLLALCLAGLNWSHLQLGTIKLAEIWWAGFAAFIFGGIAYIYPPFCVITAQLEGSRLVANRESLVIPPNFLGFGLARSIDWPSIVGVDYAVKESDPKGTIVLSLKTGERTSICTQGFNDEDLHMLLMALEIWAVNATWTSRASSFRDALQNTKLGIETSSFTQVWEEELQRRFSATTFVPHAPGTTLRNGSLRIARQLAFGGFSAIYIVRDQNDRDAVLKECAVSVNNNDPASLKSLELFQREADILKKLHHPQIARVFDHFMEGGRSYLLLEYIKGSNLRDLVRQNGPVPERQVLTWARQMAEILDYIHSQDTPIVHRDFTPDNLVVSADDQLTLIDFGAASDFATKATGTLVGKQFYMAPEQMRGKANAKSDLYSLGCTLYFLLTGNDPQALTVLRPSERAQVSSRLDSIVEKLTAQDESQRITSARELVSILQDDPPSMFLDLLQKNTGR